MKKIIVAFLVCKFLEKVIDDGMKWDSEVNGDYVTGAHEIIAYGVLKNTPLISKFLS